MVQRCLMDPTGHREFLHHILTWKGNTCVHSASLCWWGRGNYFRTVEHKTIKHCLHVYGNCGRNAHVHPEPLISLRILLTCCREVEASDTCMHAGPRLSWKGSFTTQNKNTTHRESYLINWSNSNYEARSSTLLVSLSSDNQNEKNVRIIQLFTILVYTHSWLKSEDWLYCHHNV